MILEIVFLLGLITGCMASLILFSIIYYDEIKASKEFDDRQKKYKRMI